MVGKVPDYNPTVSPRIDVTVVLTAHAEGRLAHRSLRSAQRAIGFAERRGISCELIAVLDDASRETLAYFQKQKQYLNKVSEVAFGDPGLSRNHGVELASGRYVAFLDADDLFSENWLAAAFQFSLVDRGKSSVLHPEVTVSFGVRHLVWFHAESTSASFSPYDMVQANYWTVSCFVEREFFLSGNRYAPTNLHAGFGHEDWHWNCEVMAQGGNHLIVPETAQFIRMKANGSQHARAKNMRAVFRKTTLFDQAATSASLDECRELPVKVSAASETKPLSSRLLKPAYRRARKFALGSVFKDARSKEFCVAVLNAGRKFVTPPNPATALPKWLIDEWKHIHEVEPELFPTEGIIRGIEQYNPADLRAGRLYPVLDSLIGSSPTHIFLVPSINRGGSDLEAIQQMTAVAREDVNSRVVCIATEATESPWHVRLPEAVTFVEFGKLTASFTKAERATLLLRLLIQKSPQVIHDIQSPLGHHLFKEYGRALSVQSRLFTSVFCVDTLPDGRSGGFAFAELPHYIDYLTRVLSDNQQFVERLCDIYAFEREKFVTTYFPAAPISQTVSNNFDDGCLHILWAGRMDRQKRPDILMQVATKLAGLPVHLHVYGEPQLDPGESVHIDKLRSTSNVTLYGGYNGFGSIEAAKYDLFLYTSQWDGLPNVLLEATAAGLPIIAPDVGGVKEFINEETGFLVSHAEAVDEYVAYVEAILHDRSIVVSKVDAAKALLKDRHSWTSFVTELRKVPGYFTESGDCSPSVLDNASAVID